MTVDPLNAGTFLMIVVLCIGFLWMIRRGGFLMTTPLREQVQQLNVDLLALKRQNESLQNMLIEERTLRINLQQTVEQQQHTIERQQLEINGMRALLSPTTAPTWRDSSMGMMQALQAAFSLDELASLAAELNVPMDAVAGETLTGKARELVLYHERRGELAALREAIRRARPNLKM